MHRTTIVSMCASNSSDVIVDVGVHAVAVVASGIASIRVASGAPGGASTDGAPSAPLLPSLPQPTTATPAAAPIPARTCLRLTSTRRNLVFSCARIECVSQAVPEEVQRED